MNIRSVVLLAACCGLWPGVCIAQSGTIKMVIGFPPGVSLDAMTRLLGDRLAVALKQSVIVENRAGGAARIATEHVKNAAPDGNTLLMTPFASMVINPFVYSSLRYDPVADFTPIAHIASFHFAFASGAHVPVKTLREYIDAAKRDDKLGQYSSAGAGSLPHFFSLLFARDAGLNMNHIPYKGSALALNDLMGGHIAAFIGTVADVRPLHMGGKARALATSGPTRSKDLLDVPTFRESGFANLVGGGWYALYAPAKTPRAVVERISAAVIQIVRNPEVNAKLESMGMEPSGLPAAELLAIQKADGEKWGPVIRASGFKLDD